MSSGNRLTRSLGAVGLFVGVFVALSTGILLSGCGSSTDDRPADWSYIYPAIIEPSCATADCHSRVTQRAGVDFGDADEAYYQLTCRHFVVQCLPMGSTDPCTGMPVTTAPAADCSTNAQLDSTVMHLMRAQGAQRMPPDFALPEADIQLIGAWIDNNAPQN